MAYDHPAPFIDSREVGEVAGKLLVSDDHRHIHHTYDLDNGHDYLTHEEMATIVSEELGVEVRFVGHDLDEYERVTADHPVKNYGLGMLEYSVYELEFETWFYLSDIHERLLGRKPITLREWLQEHKDQFDLSAYDS
jgi:nucleoside-diphosphate-sugar epimerase